MKKMNLRIYDYLVDVDLATAEREKPRLSVLTHQIKREIEINLYKILRLEKKKLDIFQKSQLNRIKDEIRFYNNLLSRLDQEYDWGNRMLNDRIREYLKLVNLAKTDDEKEKVKYLLKWEIERNEEEVQMLERAYNQFKTKEHLEDIETIKEEIKYYRQFLNQL